MSRRDMPLNDVEWPKDEDYVPDWGDVADAEHDRQREEEAHWWEEEAEDDYGPDDDGGEGAQAL